MSITSNKIDMEPDDSFGSATGWEEEEFEHASQSVEEDYDETCAICQDEDPTQSKIRLDCGHVFHAYCACHWFRQSPACPLCRDAPVLGGVCVGERAALVRRYSRRQSAPNDVKVLVRKLREKESSLAEKRRALCAFKKRNAFLLREFRRLQLAIDSARIATRRATVRVGVYHCTDMPVPPLRGAEDHT